MKSYCIVLVLFFSYIYSQDQTFKLQDGTIIVGAVKQETDSTYILQTQMGLATLNKDELVQTAYEIELNSGTTLSGIKLSETDEIIEFETKLGILNIQKSDIVDMKESGTDR